MGQLTTQQNRQINKFLIEAMGECYHRFSSSLRPDYCLKCGKLTVSSCLNDFFTWPGFGKLWEWAQEQEWSFDFWCKTGWKSEDIFKVIKPEPFAVAVYEFLKDRK